MKPFLFPAFLKPFPFIVVPLWLVMYWYLITFKNNPVDFQTYVGALGIVFPLALLLSIIWELVSSYVMPTLAILGEAMIASVTFKEN